MADVLIIDDDLDVAKSMQRALQGQHHTEILASARQAAAQLEQGSRYGAILCDLFMPQVNGLEFYDLVLNLDNDQAERIIFVSGGIYAADIQARVSALKNPLLQKPFSLENIRQIVGNVAARRA